MTRPTDTPTAAHADDGTTALDTWLAAARADLAQQTPPPWLLPQVLARVDERRALQAVQHAQEAAPMTGRPVRAPARPRAGWRTALLWAGVPAALAATLLAASVLLRPLAPGQGVPEAARFIALAPLETLTADPGAHVVPALVPRAHLAEFGLPVDPARADQLARAEFLLSTRGAVLAVRFVE